MEYGLWLSDHSIHQLCQTGSEGTLWQVYKSQAFKVVITFFILQYNSSVTQMEIQVVNTHYNSTYPD